MSKLHTTHVELSDLGGGRYESVINMRAIAHPYQGGLRRNVNLWTPGDGNWHHAVEQSSIIALAKNSGGMRICPTRELDTYVEFDSPHVHNPQGKFVPLGAGNLSRDKHSLKAEGADADIEVVHAGHYVTFGDVALKNGWTPRDNVVAYPLTLNGLTRKGDEFLNSKGAVVCHLRPLSLYDAANPEQRLAMRHEWLPYGKGEMLVATLPSLVGMARPVIDPTVTLQPNAADGKDSQIGATGPTLNYGVSPNWTAGKNLLADYSTYRSSIQYDLSAIPAGALVSSSSLTGVLILAGNARASNDRILRLYRILQAWTEGTGNSVATGDGVTWNTKDGVNTWQTAGCAGANDREATDIGNLLFQTTDAAGTAKTFVLTPSAVQEWISGTLTNNGLLCKADTELNDRYVMGSSDNSTPSQRPKLTVTYTVPGGSGIFSTAIFHSPIFGGSIVR